MPVEPKLIKPPLTDDVIRSLKAGDEVLITGTIYTARDMAHKRLCEAIAGGQKPPFPIEGALIYYCGPTPAAPGKPIGAAGPTTSSRMDHFTPALLAAGLKATLGKGYRNQSVIDSLKKNCAVHLSTIGGAGALLAKHITSAEIIAYEDLGTEAIRCLEVADFPAVVAYDSSGRSVYSSSPYKIVTPA